MRKQMQTVRSLCPAAVSLLLAAVLLVLVAGAGLAQDATIRVQTSDAKQAVVSKVDPVYPEMARRMNLAGEVQLDVVIDEAGKVADVKPLSGNPVLSGAAKKALLQWKFRPFEQEGKPVKAVAHFAFNFKP